MMKNFKRILLAFSLVSIVSINSCKKDDTTEPQPNTPNPNPTARELALDDYNANYVGTTVSNTGWTGSTGSCSAGLCSVAMDSAVIRRINYFRRLVGLNDHCTLDASLFAQEQETALMMTANNQLNHFPPTTWTCYTTLGAAGAASSNIALGFTGTDAITGFISDFGTGNEPVGHRRWILHSRKQKFSFGSTNNAMALYISASDTNTIVPDFIAYPPKGYIAQPLVFSRWSFSIPSANFSSATVTMTGPGGTSIPVSIISSTDNGYGDNTLVWVPTGINLTSASDLIYTVTVSNIGSASATTFTYDVVIFKP